MKYNENKSVLQYMHEVLLTALLFIVIFAAVCFQTGCVNQHLTFDDISGGQLVMVSSCCDISKALGKGQQLSISETQSILDEYCSYYYSRMLVTDHEPLLQELSFYNSKEKELFRLKKYNSYIEIQKNGSTKSYLMIKVEQVTGSSY